MPLWLWSSKVDIHTTVGVPHASISSLECRKHHRPSMAAVALGEREPGRRRARFSTTSADSGA
jgi:hypothetical protein